MRNLISLILFSAIVLLLSSCHDLNLSPLSSGSTESWYSSADEIRLAVNKAYQSDFLLMDGQYDENNSDWSDDTMYRQTLLAFQNATLDAQNSLTRRRWINNFKLISKMNAVINKYQRAISNGASENEIMPYVGEAYFFRARAYGELLYHFGDVPYYTDDIDITTAKNMSRTDKNEVAQHMNEDFDKAASLLPTSYSGDQRATRGAALAFKARYNLYLGNFAIAADAAKQVMDMGIYKLEANYAQLFLPTTTSSPEFIFIMPRSISAKLNVLDAGYVRSYIPRNQGGWACYDPTWDLLAAYTCSDGLPIDKSPLFNPHDPFKNRDPRCSMSIVAFGSEYMDYIYDPSPKAKEVKQVSTGKMVYNNDTRANKFYASFNGLVWRKYADESWITTNGYQSENPKIMMRYADVLLMYAESKIELNQIDQSVLDAMNSVRARAYGVDKSEVDKYPAFSIKPQKEMRYDLRIERRMELAGEHLRYADIIRWKIAPDVFSKKCMMLVDPSNLNALYEAGNWFWGKTPKIDENGIADFSELEAAGMCMPASERKWDDRQYLWPIPSAEIEINPNMKQNPGY